MLYTYSEQLYQTHKFYFELLHKASSDAAKRFDYPL